MLYIFEFLDEVYNDIQETKSWYSNQKDGLDDLFAQSVLNAITAIDKMPASYPVRYKNIRIAKTKIFPYHIHFYLEPTINKIVITAIVHNKRHQNISKNRQ